MAGSPPSSSPAASTASPQAALIGGAITGLVVGAGQALVSHGRFDWGWWIPATAVGMALGLLLGAAAVNYGSSLPNLAVAFGALTFAASSGLLLQVLLPTGTAPAHDHHAGPARPAVAEPR